MNNALSALLRYVKDSELGFKAVEVYHNQFKISKTDLKIIEVSGLLPNCLAVVGQCKPIAAPPRFEFDLFITTQSDSFQSDVNVDSNIKLVSELTAYIETNNTFEEEIDEELREYNIDLESVSVTPFMVNDKYAIYLIHIAFQLL